MRENKGSFFVTVGATITWHDDDQLTHKVAEITGITTPTGIFDTDRRREALGH